MSSDRLTHSHTITGKPLSTILRNLVLFTLFYGNFQAVSTRPRADCTSMEDRRCKPLITFFKRFKFNWVIGSPPKCDTLLAVWYPTYMQGRRRRRRRRHRHHRL